MEVSCREERHRLSDLEFVSDLCHREDVRWSDRDRYARLAAESGHGRDRASGDAVARAGAASLQRPRAANRAQLVHGNAAILIHRVDHSGASRNAPGLNRRNDLAQPVPDGNRCFIAGARRQ